MRGPYPLPRGVGCPHCSGVVGLSLPGLPELLGVAPVAGVVAAAAGAGVAGVVVAVGVVVGLVRQVALLV